MDDASWDTEVVAGERSSPDEWLSQEDSCRGRWNAGVTGCAAALVAGGPAILRT